MKRPVFSSVFAPHIADYLEYRVRNGFKEDSFWLAMKKLDMFALEEGVEYIRMSEEETRVWMMQGDEESRKAYYKRINGSRDLFVYLHRMGFDVMVFPKVAYPESFFNPHIYTGDEIERYFLVVDTHPWICWQDKLQLPVLFRLLYCCGLRISEALGIRKGHIDLDEGVIKLVEAKNSKSRYVVMSDTMAELMRDFATLYFYQLNDNDFIFRSRNGNALTSNNVRKKHRIILEMANIPFIGDHRGPRLHDWRHTFCVQSLFQMKDSGHPLRSSLPHLVRYLGHETILDTEKYIHIAEAVPDHIGADFISGIACLIQEADDEKE